VDNLSAGNDGYFSALLDQLYSILKSDWSGMSLLLLIDVAYGGFYCVRRLFAYRLYAMTITALRFVSMRKQVVGRTHPMKTTRVGRPWSLGHSCLVFMCKRVALATVKNNVFLMYVYRCLSVSVS